MTNKPPPPPKKAIYDAEYQLDCSPRVVRRLPRWHRVLDLYPPLGQDVLVWAPAPVLGVRRRLSITRFELDPDSQEIYAHAAILPSDDVRTIKATHWMELPEPPS